MKLMSNNDNLMPSDIKAMQSYIKNVSKERGFDKETLQDAFVLLSEEVGELARIDLATAFWDKEFINKKRSWT